MILALHKVSSKQKFEQKLLENIRKARGGKKILDTLNF